MIVFLAGCSSVGAPSCSTEDSLSTPRVDPAEMLTDLSVSSHWINLPGCRPGGWAGTSSATTTELSLLGSAYVQDGVAQWSSADLDRQPIYLAQAPSEREPCSVEFVGSAAGTSSLRANRVAVQPGRVRAGPSRVAPAMLCIESVAVEHSVSVQSDSASGRANLFLAVDGAHWLPNGGVARIEGPSFTGVLRLLAIEQDMRAVFSEDEEGRLRIDWLPKEG
jgi:hypothetical protein